MVESGLSWELGELKSEALADGELSSASSGLEGDSRRGELRLGRVPSSGHGISGCRSPWVLDVSGSRSWSLVSTSVATVATVSGSLLWLMKLDRGSVAGLTVGDSVIIRAGSGRSVDLLVSISRSVVRLRGGSDSGEKGNGELEHFVFLRIIIGTVTEAI